MAAKQIVKPFGGQSVVCAKCGKTIPAGDNGIAVDCVWWQDKFLCWDCVKSKGGVVGGAGAKAK